jgi:hypothetical protein
MDVQHILQLFKEQVQHTTPWEWAAVLLGVTEVLLAKVNNILAVPYRHSRHLDRYLYFINGGPVCRIGP